MRGLLVKLAIVSIACALPICVLGLIAVSQTRLVLWRGVRACVADFKLTGFAFPCLFVDLTGEGELGYVVLKSPFGTPDTVLAPTRKVVGVEDPWLQSPSAPNYFDAAWRARFYLKDQNGRSPKPDVFALAVNSAFTRSQDQLHIHLGCLRPTLSDRLSSLASGLLVGAWTRVDLIPGSVVWALRTGRRDLSGVEPFRLAAEGLGDKIQDRGRLTIFVTGARLADEELLILVTDAHASVSSSQVEVDDLIDLACSVRSVVPGLH